MVKHIWSLLCKESKIDAQTNSISIIDAYENLEVDASTPQEVNLTEKPVGMPINYELVSVYFRDKKGERETFDQTIVVLDPQGREIGKFDNSVVFEETQDRVRNIVKFNMIGLTGSGIYIYQIWQSKDSKNTRKQQVASLPLTVKLRLNGKDY